MDISNRRIATRQELREIKAEAARQLQANGFPVTRQSIESTVNRLLHERNLQRPKTGRQSKRRSATPDQYLNSPVLAAVAGVAQREASRSDLRRLAKSEGRTADFYYVRVPQPYVKYAMPLVRKTRATDVYVALLHSAGGDMETWPSLRTLRTLTGLSTNTIRKSLAALESIGVIEIRDAKPGTKALNGKIIRKKRGYVYKLNPPIAWRWNDQHELGTDET